MSRLDVATLALLLLKWKKKACCFTGIVDDECTDVARATLTSRWETIFCDLTVISI